MPIAKALRKVRRDRGGSLTFDSSELRAVSGMAMLRSRDDAHDQVWA